MIACEQTNVAYVPWWLTVFVAQVCTGFNVMRFTALMYRLSTVVWAVQNISMGYQQWKIKTSVSAHLIEAHKERFPSYHCFQSQLIYYITIAVCSCEHGAEEILSLSNIQQMLATQQWELISHMYTHLWNRCWQSVAQPCLWSAFYQDDVLQVCLQNHWTIELQFLWWSL